MSRTNKHKRSSTRETKSSTTTANEKISSNAGSSDTSTGTGGNVLLTTPQLNSFILLSMGLSYLMQMKTVLFENENCNAYLHPDSQKEDIEDGDKSCSHQELAILMAKFHSGVSCTILVGLCMIVCWRNSLLLLRLHTFLSATPLASSILAVQLTKTIINPTFAGKLGMMVTTLLILVAGSLYNAPGLAPREPIKGDLSNATLLTLSAGFGWEAYKLLIGGAAKFMKGTNEGEEASPASFVLMPFLMVDQLTLVALCVFAIAFLPDSSKRYFLFTIGSIQMVSHYYLIPQIRDDLMDAEYYDNFTFGSAVFSLTASIAPSITFFEINTPVTTDEESENDKKKD